MKLSDRLTVPDHLMARQVGDDCVMLDLASGTYFGLDTVGARIWQMVCEGKSLAETCDVIMDEYDVPRDKIEGDVMRLIEELVGKGLLVQTHSARS